MNDLVLFASIIGLYVIIGVGCSSIGHAIDDLTDVLRRIKNE